MKRDVTQINQYNVTLQLQFIPDDWLSPSREIPWYNNLIQNAIGALHKWEKVRVHLTIDFFLTGAFTGTPPDHAIYTFVTQRRSCITHLKYCLIWATYIYAPQSCQTSIERTSIYFNPLPRISFIPLKHSYRDPDNS